MRADLIERIKAVSETFALLAVDFLDSSGEIASKSLRDVSKVKMTFSNGEEFMITYQEFQSFDDFKFKLDEKGRFSN